MILFKRGDSPSWIRSQYRYKVPMRYGFLKNVSTDQIAYAAQASEAVVIVSQDRSTELRMDILRENYEHSDEKLYVTFYENESHKLLRIIDPWPLTSEEVFIHGITVEFEVKHQYFNSLVKSVNSVHDGMIRRLLPTPQDFFELMSIPEFDIKYLLSKVPCGIKIDGKSQFKALRTILSCNRSSPPIIVNGSFGSGKTRLLAVATYCVIFHGMRSNNPVRVLISAHHYHSVDHFIEEYFGSMFSRDSPVLLYRLMNDTYYIKSSRFSNFYVTIEDLKRSLSSSPPWFLVIVTEFLTAQSLLPIFGEDFFTHIFVDEGSQTVEPQTISPLSLAGQNTKVVIAGDPCQVTITQALLSCDILVYLSGWSFIDGIRRRS